MKINIIFLGLLFVLSCHQKIQDFPKDSYEQLELHREMVYKESMLYRDKETQAIMDSVYYKLKYPLSESLDSLSKPVR